MSLWHEIEDLKKKKAELEFQLHSIEEKEKTLDIRAKMLEERIAIQELEERVKIKSAAVEKLECRIGELEQKLKEPESSTITPEPESQENVTGYSLRKLFGEH